MTYEANLSVMNGQVTDTITTEYTDYEVFTMDCVMALVRFKSDVVPEVFGGTYERLYRADECVNVKLNGEEGLKIMSWKAI